MWFMAPAVKSEEVDFSDYVGRQSTCIVAMVGGGCRGPIGVPTLITSPSGLVQTFGETMLDDFGIVSALEFLKQGNILYYYRAAEDSAKESSVELLEGVLTIEALYKGTDGDNISVEVVNTTGTLAQLNVYENKSLKEVHEFSFNPDSEQYVDNIKSSYVTAYYNDLSDEQISVREFFNSFVRVGDNEYTLTSSQQINELAEIDIAVDAAVAVGAVRIEEDSFGILKKGDVGGSGITTDEATKISLAEAARIKVPVNLLSQFDVKVASYANVVDEESYKAIFPASFVADMPWEGDQSRPVKGNPWISTSVNCPVPGMRVRYEVYPKSRPDVPAIVEVHRPEGVVNEFAFATAGEKYMAFEAMKSREDCDTLNLGILAEDTVFTCRISLIKDDEVVQILEKDFMLEAADFVADSPITVKAPILGSPAAISPIEETPKGLRHVSIMVSLQNIRGKETKLYLHLHPTDEEVKEVPAPIIDGPVYPSITNNSLVYLSGGSNGTPLKPSTVVKGVRAFVDSNTYDINLIAAPGFWQKQVVAELTSVAESRTDCMAIIDTPQGLSPQQALDWHNGRLEGEDYLTTGLNSSYTACYYPWVKISDVFTEKDLWIPPSGPVLGAFAYNDSVGQAWFAPAGMNRGMLKSVIGVERSLDDGERDILYGNSNVINSIINYKQQGFTIFGQRTTQRKTSATDRVNVRRLVNLVRKTIVASTAYVLFDQIDDITYRRWVGTVSPQLETIKKSRGLYDYRVVMDDTTTPAEAKDRNEMYGKVFLKPTKTAEFIGISFIITSSGATFIE